MNSLLRIPYSTAAGIADALTRVVPAGESKFRRALSGRRGIIERYRAWGGANRSSMRPLMWFHAPSVGEGLQAAPVIRLLRERLANVQIAYTFYSPSAEQFARSLSVDFCDYLPFDSYDNARAIIDALHPTILVFSKLDIWPALTETASRARIPVGVVSATLPESSARRGLLARAFLGDAYRSLARVGAIDERDAERLREQGVPSDRVTVTGDTRYDQVAARAQKPTPDFVERLRSARPTLVAGSTWPADETHLFASWRRVLARIPDARLIIAPHETTPAHLRSISNWAAREKLSISRLDDPRAADADVVVVDRYGVLGDLYALADVAYVGGGFHAAGLHSVLEPAAFGAPVLFGPQNEKSRDAQLLRAAGGGAEVTAEADLTIRLCDWLGSQAARDVSGQAAKRVVDEGLGAADRSFALVTTLLNQAASE